MPNIGGGGPGGGNGAPAIKEEVLGENDDIGYGDLPFPNVGGIEGDICPAKVGGVNDDIAPGPKALAPLERAPDEMSEESCAIS